MVNNPGLNINPQAQAVVAAEGATSVSSVVQDIKKSDPGKEVKKTEWMERLLETGGTKDLTNQLLKDLVTKVAQAGIAFEGVSPQSKIDGKTQGAKKSDSLQDEFSDKVELGTSKDAKGTDKTIPVKGIGQKGSKFGKPEAEILAKWQEIKEQLIKEGKSAQEISRMESQFKASETKRHLLNLLKDSAILCYLDSENKISQIIRRRGFAELLQRAGRELGKEAAVEAKSEVEGFILHELENQLILRTFLQDGDFKESYQLMKIGDKIGVDSLSWMENVWPLKRCDHGLNLLDVPHEITGYVNVMDNNPDSHRRRREREKYEYKEEDEKDIVLNRLRAQYMQLALRPGALTSLKTWFKIRKLKNGLVRLGVYTKDLDERLQSEAKTLAKMKTMEMLDEALHERASLFDPTKDKLVENKIKNCLKNLERLGFALGDKEFSTLRDKANRHMHGLVQRELESTKSKKGPRAEKKGQRLNKLLARLRQETDLGLKEEA